MRKRDMIALLVIVLWVIINVLILRFFSVCDVDKDLHKRKDTNVIK